MFKKVCPCLAWLRNQSNKGTSNHAEYQQQQFMEHLQEQTKYSQQYSYDVTGESLSIQQQLQRQINPPQMPKINPLYIQPQKNQQQCEPQQIQQVGDIKQSEDLLQIQQIPEFKLNIDPQSQYYLIIKQAAQDFEQLLKIGGDKIDSKSGMNNLHMNRQKLSIWNKEITNDYRSFVLSYELPCSYAYYSQMMNKNYRPQNKHKIFYESRILESIYPNLSARYISTNKISLLQKRKFAYLKYINAFQNHHWEICISLDTLFPKQQYNSDEIKSGKFHSISLLTQRVGEQGPYLKIKTYVKMDISVKVDKMWQKIHTLLKNYLQGLWKQASQNYQEQLV